MYEHRIITGVYSVFPSPSTLGMTDEASDSPGDTEADGFLLLPCELKLHVLSYLGHRDLVRVAQVSRELRRLAYDPSLWKALVVARDVDRNTMLTLLHRVRLLEDLSLRGSSLVPVVADCAERIRRLQQLDVGFSSDVTVATVSRLVEHCPELLHLNVEGCKTVDDDVLECLTRLTQFMSLNMSHCGKVTDDGVIKLARGCPQLRFLNADGISRITDR